MTVGRARVAAIALSLVFFAAVAPTLRWLEFSNGAEGLNLATAMEIRRTGNWVAPTLNGQPRLAKPPLTSWIAAASMRSSTLSDVVSTDPRVRHAAFDRLALDVRWPALLAACVTLYLTFALARVLLGDPRAGVIALCVAGSAVLWLRFARYATSDVQLAMWVTLANAALAYAVLRGRWIVQCSIAGVALGLAILSKGPVCLLETIVPTVVFLAWRGRGAGGSMRPAVTALFLGVLLMLAVALPWFIVTALRQPAAWSTWLAEVSREGATNQEPDKWYAYLAFIVFVAPWSVFFIVGLIDAIQRVVARRADGSVYALALLLVPVFVMAFFHDRQIRYLLPMLAPAAVLTAAGVRLWWIAPAHDRIAHLVEALHWLGLAALVIGVPLAAATVPSWFPRIDGGAWFSMAAGIASAVAGAAVLLVGALSARRARAALIVASVTSMLALQALFVYGYKDAPRGRADMRPLADLIANDYATADVYTRGRLARPDMNIYLNRPVRPWSELEPPGARPQVLLLFDDADVPGEPQPPSGWEPLGAAARHEDHWLAFVRRPVRND